MDRVATFKRHPPWRFVFFEWLFQEGERGYLEGLASRYADLFRTHYGDVLEPLEELRRRETNASPRMPNTQLTTSHSQPIYVPGKYSVSKSVSFSLFLIFLLSFLFIFTSLLCFSLLLLDFCKNSLVHASGNCIYLMFYGNYTSLWMGEEVQVLYEIFLPVRVASK